MTTNIVTNISDLTPAMRSGLRHWNTATAATRRALARRGLVVDFEGMLTEAGQRVVDKINAESNTATTPDEAADLYAAVRQAVPALIDVARYVAQLRRWAAEKPDDAWNKGRVNAFAMVANQLEQHVLRDLAPLLMPEATRLDANRPGSDAQED